MKRQHFRTNPVMSPDLFKSIPLILSLLVVLLFFPSSLVSKPKYGGKVTLGIEYQIYGFDAIKSRLFTASAQTAGHLIMERLFDIDVDGNLTPMLGLSLNPSDDGKVWTVALRKGVKFHDGTPFNADAVLDHWNRLSDPKNRYRGMRELQPIESLEKVDDYTIRYQLKHPWKPFAVFLAARKTMAFWIPSPKAAQSGKQNRAPVGTGPFMFKEWKSNDHLVLTKNPNYWQKGKPYLDEIAIQSIPDANTRNAALISGQVDLIYTDRPSYIKQLMNDSRFNIHMGKGTGAGVLILNTRKAPLNDIRVRQALAHAWDQEKYIKLVFRDIVPFATHWFGNTVQCDDVAYRYPDIQKAKALINEYGKPVEVEYIHSNTNRGRESAQVIQQLFKKINVTVKPIPLDWGAIYRRIFQRKFDLASWGIPSFDDMGPVSMITLHSKGAYNASGYSNAAVNDLLIKQNTTLDPEVRQNSLCEVARHVNTDAPILPMCGRRYYVFSSKKVKNLPPPHQEAIRLNEVWLEE